MKKPKYDERQAGDFAKSSGRLTTQKMKDNQTSYGIASKGDMYFPSNPVVHKFASNSEISKFKYPDTADDIYKAQQGNISKARGNQVNNMERN